MRKLFFTFGALALLSITSINTSNAANTSSAILGGCGEGQTQVSWYAECPSGTYSGSICVAKKDALKAAQQIASADCPPQ